MSSYYFWSEIPGLRARSLQEAIALEPDHAE